MSESTAIVLGGTGLVGSWLLRLLLSDPRFGRVVALGRRPSGVVDPKLVEHVIDFDDPSTWRELVQGDVLFSALGTTLRTAGSRDAQWRVDHDYQFQVAEAARGNGVTTWVLISSAGANPDSRIFYTRMKGELERDGTALAFPRARFLRPGPLAGERREHRRGEVFTLRLLGPLAPVLPAAARPIHAEAVAHAAIAAAFDPTPGALVLEPRDLFRLAAPHGGRDGGAFRRPPT